MAATHPTAPTNYGRLHEQSDQVYFDDCSGIAFARRVHSCSRRPDAERGPRRIRRQPQKEKKEEKVQKEDEEEREKTGEETGSPP